MHPSTIQARFGPQQYDLTFPLFPGGGQSASNPMAGMAGLNIGALPMNPALVAAALNQAGWSLMGNLQQGGGGGPTGAPGTEHGAFTGTPTSFPATVTPGGGPGAPHAGGVTTMANSAPQAPGNGSAGFLGWGASPPGGACEQSLFFQHSHSFKLNKVEMG